MTIKNIIHKVKVKLSNNKVSKEQANYASISHAENQMCENCPYAYPSEDSKDYYCRKVEGNIDLGAWCNLWEGK